MIQVAKLSAAALRLLPRNRLSASMGVLASLPAGPLASAAIEMFTRVYDVDMDEAVIPAHGFRTFNDFFTRALKPGARPIDESREVITSPADGKVEDCGVVQEDQTFLVKGQVYRASELLGSEEEGERYAGGTFAIVYLSPRDYHRVHAPVEGSVSSCRYIPGTLFPVNKIGIEHVPQLFARNERMVIKQTSVFGDVTTVMVGAIGVGRIGLTFDQIESNVGDEGGLRDYGTNGPPMAKGEELGRFYLGSTAVVFLEKSHGFEICPQQGEFVRMGEPLAKRTRTNG